MQSIYNILWFLDLRQVLMIKCFINFLMVGIICLALILIFVLKNKEISNISKMTKAIKISQDSENFNC